MVGAVRTVAVVVLPGVLDSSLALLVDALSAANEVRAARGEPRAIAVRLYAAVAGARGAAIVRSGQGQRIRTRGDLAALARHRPEVVVVPGQRLVEPAHLLADVRAPARAALGRALARASARGALVAGACSAVFHLAAAGLLRGRAATTAWFLAPCFRAAFPDVELRERATLVRDGRTWTAGAALSMVDLALALVRELAGPRIEALVARYLILEQHPTQARYMLAAHYASADPLIARADAWVRARLAERFSIGQLARALGTSDRTLTRRFAVALATPPIRFVQRVRAEHAAHLLATSHLSIEEISARVGYRDASTLRRVLRRELAQSGRELRAARDPGMARRPAARSRESPS
jgi:transcriptional regulator GlxA family with amidase domain